MVAGGLTDAPAARAPWLAFAAALALAGWLGWKAYGPEEPGDPLATSLVALEKQNRELQEENRQLRERLTTTPNRLT